MMNHIILSAVRVSLNNRTLFNKLNRKLLKTKKSLLMKKMKMTIYQATLNSTTLPRRRSRRIWECKVCGDKERSSKLLHLSNNNIISQFLLPSLKWRSWVRRHRSISKMSQLMNWMKKKIFISHLSLILITNLEISMNIQPFRLTFLSKQLQLNLQPILYCYHQIHQINSWIIWEHNQTTSWTPKTHFWQMM